MFALLAVHAPPTKQVESWGVPGRLDMSGAAHLCLCVFYWFLCVRVLLCEPFLRGEALHAGQRVSSRPHRHCGSSLSCPHRRDSSTAVSEHSQIIMIWTCDVIMIWDYELIAAVLWHPAEHSNFGVADSLKRVSLSQGFIQVAPWGLDSSTTKKRSRKDAPPGFARQLDQQCLTKRPWVLE